jgi:hypothetical protein
MSLTDEQRTTAICREINAISQTYKAQRPWLRYQNALGLGIFSISIAAIVWAMYGYCIGTWSAWVAMLWIAFWTSILHELEHDLIHQLYFKDRPFWHNLMLAGVWLFRPLTLNPWMRRYIHYHHHKYSGTASDIEERSLNNGMAWSFLRLLTTADLLLAGALRSRKMRTEVRQLYQQGCYTTAEVRNLRRITLYGFLPLGIPLHFVWYSFLLYYTFVGFGVLGQLWGGASLSVAWTSALSSMPLGWQHYTAAITPLVVLLIAPNMWRQFCLHFITSNMHYYGDVERGNIVQQTQVLNAWWLAPLQLFCFNFGSTHTIHHFVVNDPFYLRQLIAAPAHKVLQRYGIRFNDIGTFFRANRYMGSKPA